MCVVQHSLSLGLYGDDPGGPEYLELEVGVAGDGHEQDSDANLLLLMFSIGC
jgi:hypothetical protein